MSDLIYLASPHRHSNRFVEHQREQEVLRYTAWMARQGELVFCPIAYGRALWTVTDFPLGWEYWKALDSRMVMACDELRIMCIPGWRESTGIGAEIKLAMTYKKRITYASPRGVFSHTPLRTVEYADWALFWAGTMSIGKVSEKQLLLD